MGESLPLGAGKLLSFSCQEEGAAHLGHKIQKPKSTSCSFSESTWT